MTHRDLTPGGSGRYLGAWPYHLWVKQGAALDYIWGLTPTNGYRRYLWVWPHRLYLSAPEYIIISSSSKIKSKNFGRSPTFGCPCPGPPHNYPWQKNLRQNKQSIRFWGWFRSKSGSGNFFFILFNVVNWGFSLISQNCISVRGVTPCHTILWIKHDSKRLGSFSGQH